MTLAFEPKLQLYRLRLGLFLFPQIAEALRKDKLLRFLHSAKGELQWKQNRVEGYSFSEYPVVKRLGL
jgi:hypothetical protein